MSEQPPSESTGAASDSRGSALVILAAGASKRLGQCKALVDLEGQSPLARLLDQGRSISAVAPLVVTGAHHRKIAAAEPEGCELLENPNWEAGRTGGLALAAAARVGFDLCVAPVDVPLVPRNVFWILENAWSALDAPQDGWLAPSFEGRYGHPIWIGRRLASELLSWEPDRPLRELRAQAKECLAVEVPHPEILDDLDRSKDLEGLRRRIRRG